VAMARRHSTPSWPCTRMEQRLKSSSSKSAVCAAGFRYSRVNCSTAFGNPPSAKSQSADGYALVMVRRADTSTLVLARPLELAAARRKYASDPSSGAFGAPWQYLATRAKSWSFASALIS
jgi:hypothetical protein